MNGWFPKLDAAGRIASGNSGIWLTDAAGSRQVSPVGTGPVWAGAALAFNRNDGTTDVGGAVVPTAYNDMVGADDGRWAGFVGVGAGRVDVYRGASLLGPPAAGICAPRFGGSRFAYLAPFQPDPSGQRNLVLDNAVVASGVIMDAQLSRGGEFYVYLTATGKYTRQVFDAGGPVGIRDDEAPLVAFVGPGGEPWMLSGAGEFAFVRPLRSPLGYLIEGDLYYPDARMLDGRLRVVASLRDGTPRFDTWIDFTAPRRDLRATAPVPIPTFRFNHDVTVAVFKDPDGITAAPVEVLVNENRQRASRPVFVADDTLATGKWNGPLLGVYTEARGDALPKALALAAGLKTRLLVCHDKQEPWTLPAGLRPWDVPAIELYRFKLPVEETLRQAVARWRRDRDAMLAAWPGDCGVVPMFYCMGGAAGGNPPELWPVSVPLETLAFLEEIVNSSPRIKLVLPFEYLRANGIVAHGELQQAYDNLLAAAPVPAVLLPVGGAPVPPKPVPPQPQPPLPTSPYLHHKGAKMNIDGKKVVLRGPGGLLMRPDAPNTGTWGGLNKGWRGAIFDGHDANDARYHHTAAALGSRYTFTHAQNKGFAGADSGEHSPALDKQYYYTPDNSDPSVAGDLEQFRVYDGNENGALQAQTELKTTAEHPSGAGKAFFAYAVAVEVV